LGVKSRADVWSSSFSLFPGRAQGQLKLESAKR
jgi:hypothetical protein